MVELKFDGSFERFDAHGASSCLRQGKAIVVVGGHMARITLNHLGELCDSVFQTAQPGERNAQVYAGLDIVLDLVKYALESHDGFIVFPSFQINLSEEMIGGHVKRILRLNLQGA